MASARELLLVAWHLRIDLKAGWVVKDQGFCCYSYSQRHISMGLRQTAVGHPLLEPMSRGV